MLWIRFCSFSEEYLKGYISSMFYSIIFLGNDIHHLYALNIKQYEISIAFILWDI